MQGQRLQLCHRMHPEVRRRPSHHLNCRQGARLWHGCLGAAMETSQGKFSVTGHETHACACAAKPAAWQAQVLPSQQLQRQANPCEPWPGTPAISACAHSTQHAATRRHADRQQARPSPVTYLGLRYVISTSLKPPSPTSCTAARPSPSASVTKGCSSASTSAGTMGALTAVAASSPYREAAGLVGLLVCE